MLYSFSLIPFIIIAHPFLIRILRVKDKMLIAFMKVHQETQISEYSKQKYEAHLGIMYFMRKNWHCDKIADEFKEYERTECQKYRKYLDILFEYLSREYFRIPTVKPKLVFKTRIEIEGPIIYAMNCLAKISQFYFIKSFGLHFEYKLNKLFTYYSNPKLLNEKRLNYEAKLSTNEMILQLAIDIANEWQINESLEGIILKNFGEKFEEYLEEMFKKAEERAKKDNNSRRANEINDDKHKIIIGSKFDDQWNWTEDVFFSVFVKGLGTNFEKFFRMGKEYSNYSFGLYEIEKMKEFLTQFYETRLGVMYLMRENWQCPNTFKFINYKSAKCQKYRKYLDILYEYLFRLYVEGKSSELAKEFPAVMPKFMHYYNNNQRNLVSIVKTLNDISKCFWQNTSGNNNYYLKGLIFGRWI